MSHDVSVMILIETSGLAAKLLGSPNAQNNILNNLNAA
jgi:hypothetical protein